MTADSIAKEKIEPLNQPRMFTHGTIPEVTPLL